jgi:hypothetical protein
MHELLLGAHPLGDVVDQCQPHAPSGQLEGTRGGFHVAHAAVLGEVAALQVQD